MFLALSRFLKTFLLPIRQCCGLHIISSSLPGGDTDALGLCHEGIRHENLTKQTCGATCWGGPSWIRERLKVSYAGT